MKVMFEILFLLIASLIYGDGKVTEPMCPRANQYHKDLDCHRMTRETCIAAMKTLLAKRLFDHRNNARPGAIEALYIEVGAGANSRNSPVLRHALEREILTNYNPNVYRIRFCRGYGVDTLVRITYQA